MSYGFPSDYLIFLLLDNEINGRSRRYINKTKLLSDGLQVGHYADLVIYGVIRWSVQRFVAQIISHVGRRERSTLDNFVHSLDR